MPSSWRGPVNLTIPPQGLMGSFLPDPPQRDAPRGSPSFHDSCLDGTLSEGTIRARCVYSETRDTAWSEPCEGRAPGCEADDLQLTSDSSRPTPIAPCRH